MGLLLSAALLAALSLPQSDSSDCREDGSVVWRVEGGFATLRPEAASRGDALLDSVAAAGGRMTPKAGSSPSAYDAIVSTLVDDGRPPALHTLTWWDRDQERYVDRDAMLEPDAVWIQAQYAAGGNGQCEWSIDGATTRQPCAAARLSITRREGRIRGDVSVRFVDGNGGGGVGRACPAVAERLILGLGDSYASGEGNPDRPTRWLDVPAVANAVRGPMPAYRDGRRRDRLGLWDRRRDGPVAHAPAAADAQWWDNSCHRSLLSQQALAAIGYAAADRHRRVVFASLACSGATVFDGVLGPRLEAPGVTRVSEARGKASAALRLSQLEQAIELLCVGMVLTKPLEVPATAPTWRWLSAKSLHGKGPRTVRIPRCEGRLRAPDALLLSVGGNDVGFGGVGAWALLPPGGRLPIDVVPLANKMFGGGALKKGFGLVCPGGHRENRCRLKTDDLVLELDVMLKLLDDAFNDAGLGGVKVKLHAAYPQVTRAEDGGTRGCFGEEVGGERYELLNEPWLPAYASVLDRPVRTDWIWRWSFGIQSSEMRIIDREVLAPLNAAIARHANWTIVASEEMPRIHGICAVEPPLAAMLREGARAERIRPLVLAEFGWPRFVNGGWSDDRPAPTDWQPYADRARWVRTATDSALTQSVFDGGTAAKRVRRQDNRLSEALSGTLHPALPMNAAIGELLASRLKQVLQ